jgi:hypothetical protein
MTLLLRGESYNEQFSKQEWMDMQQLNELKENDALVLILERYIR